ncbi:MAG: hypothetical protein R2792_02825 [Saprospiraceae bacterium]
MTLATLLLSFFFSFSGIDGTATLDSSLPGDTMEQENISLEGQACVEYITPADGDF